MPGARSTRPPRLVDEPARDALDAQARELLRHAHAPLPEEVWNRVWVGFVTRLEEPGRRNRRWLRVVLAAAAVLAAVVGFAHWLGSARPHGGHAVDVRGVARVEERGSLRPLRSGSILELPSRIVVQRGGSAEVALERGVDVTIDGPSALWLDARSAELESGRARHHVRSGHGRWEVRLGGYRVVVKGTQFWTGLSGDEASVCLIEGQVEIRRSGALLDVLDPGEAWRSSPSAPAFPDDIACRLSAPRDSRLAASPQRAEDGRGSPPAEPASVPPAEPVSAAAPATVPRQGQVAALLRAEPPPSRAELEVALAPAPPPRREELLPLPEALPSREAAAQRCPDEESCAREAANGETVRSQNALYRLGEIRRARGDAEGALDAWLEYRRRFTGGVLAPEADLSILETRLRLGSPLALRAAERFLEHWPGSEHDGEVHAIRGALRQRAGDCAGALGDFDRALAARVSAARRDESAYGRAACLAAAGRTADAAEAYRSYLADHPSGRYANQAREGLRALTEPPAPSP